MVRSVACLVQYIATPLFVRIVSWNVVRVRSKFVGEMLLNWEPKAYCRN